MDIDWTLNAGNIIVAVGMILGGVVAWVKISERSSQNKEAIERLRRDHEESEVRIGAVMSSLQMFREEVARQYPSHAALRQIMDPIREDMHYIRGRIDDLYNGKRQRDVTS